jgi:hypothetical protein
MSSVMAAHGALKPVILAQSQLTPFQNWLKYVINAKRLKKVPNVLSGVLKMPWNTQHLISVPNIPVIRS